MESHSLPLSSEVLSSPPLVDINLIESQGLTSEALQTTLSTLEVIQKMSEKHHWPRIKDNRHPIIFQLHRIKQLGKAITSSQKRLGRQFHKKNRILAREERQDQFEDTGIRQLRRERKHKFNAIFDPTPTLTSTVTIEEEAEDAEHPEEDAEHPSETKETEEQKEEPPKKKPKLTQKSYSCYVCKAPTQDVHHFYDCFCLPCADFNFQKRNATADLTGRVALLTGGRLKIGYEIGLKLLRADANLIVTTRFPNDCLVRYQHELDYTIWKDRLHIYGLDLRFLPLVEAFCQHITDKYKRLDILIQNAAQTLRRPTTYYKHLMASELGATSHPQIQAFSLPLQQLQSSSQLLLAPPPTFMLTAQESNEVPDSQLPAMPTSTQIVSTQMSTNTFSSLASQLQIHPDDFNTPHHLFPAGQYDADHQQLDLRSRNTWMMEADQVDTTELMEVNVINYLAPYTLLSKLTPLMKATASETGCLLTSEREQPNYTWVVMVSSMEGQFNRSKTTHHPHTNAAKAALNMIVRTSGSYYQTLGILMTCVDTGWVTDEYPTAIQHKGQRNFHPPLDEIDGASRVLDPIFKTLNDNVIEYGVFYKDYKPTHW